MPSRASSRYFTTIVLPGGCEFLVHPPSSLRLPYYPANPRIEHTPNCQCMDEDRYMDDDSVFMSIWLSFWVIWNGRRILAPELREDPEYREKARGAFSIPEMRATVQAWDLPLIGRDGFKPSPRTIRPIEWFWNSLEGARDLAHCRQPDHATRFQIRFDLPRGPAWREKLPRRPAVEFSFRASEVRSAGENMAYPMRRNSNATARSGSTTKVPGNKGRSTTSSSRIQGSNTIENMGNQIAAFEVDIMKLLGSTPDEIELHEQAMSGGTLEIVVKACELVTSKTPEQVFPGGVPKTETDEYIAQIIQEIVFNAPPVASGAGL